LYTNRFDYVIVFNKDVLEDTDHGPLEMKALNPNASRSMSISGVTMMPTSHNPIFSGTMDQTYTVTVMDVDGLCMLTKEIRVIVTPDIGLDAMPDTLICEMGELEITATVTRDFPIEWYSDRVSDRQHRHRYSDHGDAHGSSHDLLRSSNG
jgi:hypothetical protein